MKVVIIAGARPNFVKAAALFKAAQTNGVDALIVHTGQHYDQGMSEIFFQELDLPMPAYHLGVGSGSHAQVTARCLERLEPVLIKERPDWVLVVGDVNSTLAGALAAVKLGVPTAHVEAGLRSFDRSMPEEINRVATDAIVDLHFISERSGLENLRREGHAEEKLHLVGNVMIDTLGRFLAKARQRNTAKRLGLSHKAFCLMTLHRPSNVDGEDGLLDLLEKIEAVQERIPIVFPIHPRTKLNFQRSGLLGRLQGLGRVILLEPLGYLDFLCVMDWAKLVVTDSGGVQEETTVLGVPCLTMRDNTERPITVEEGTNVLVGARGERLLGELDKALDAPSPGPRRPHLWDGKASDRIVKILKDLST